MTGDSSNHRNRKSYIRSTAWTLGALVGVAVLFYAAFQIYDRYFNPLVVGIAPVENADGTVDYTLLATSRDGEKSKWVLRIPKTHWVSALPGGDVEFSGSGVGITFRRAPNETIVLHLLWPGLRPAPYQKNRELGNRKPEELESFINAINNSEDRFASMQGGILNQCIPTGKNAGTLIEYGDGSQTVTGKDKKNCRVISGMKDFNYMQSDSTKPRAVLGCNFTREECSYYLEYKKRALRGAISTELLKDWDSVTSALTAFLDEHTIYDGPINQ